jgi:predicted phage terminase large subunit-like protein
MTSLEQAFHDTIVRREFDLFLRRCVMTLNPGARFLPNWHIAAIADRLARVRRGEINRLIINMPPRHLKSLTVSVAFPAHLLGLQPWRRIFAISYGSELSTKHAGDFRSIVESPWYRRAFPDMRIARSLEDDVETTARGFRRATSVYGTLTGLGGDIFIIDDPQKPVDAQSDTQRNRLNQWVPNTLMSRLDNKETGIIIVVMQRVHLNDLSGYLMESGGWEVLSLPAIAEQDETVAIGENEFHQRHAGEALHPELESLESLKELQRKIGSDVFAAQYQQSPVPPGGATIRRRWLRYYDQLPERTYAATIIQSWDTAAKDGAQNDWSVCTTWMVLDNRYYLINLIRGRFEYPSLKAAAISLAQLHRPRCILIEDASTGIALAQELKNIYFGGTTSLVPIERDKIGRLYVNQAKFEAGLVLFPREASFLPELEAELLTFPQGKTDDHRQHFSSPFISIKLRLYLQRFCRLAAPASPCLLTGGEADDALLRSASSAE